MPDLLIGQTKYFVYCNTEGPRQSLGYLAPDQVYNTLSGGGAMIVEKYSATEKI
jgi:putative transposase